MFVRGCDKRRHIVGSSCRSARKKHRARVESPLFVPISGPKRKKETAAPGLAINAWPDYCERDDTVMTGRRMGGGGSCRAKKAEVCARRCMRQSGVDSLRCSQVPFLPASLGRAGACLAAAAANHCLTMHQHSASGNAPGLRVRSVNSVAINGGRTDTATDDPGQLSHIVEHVASDAVWCRVLQSTTWKRLKELRLKRPESFVGRRKEIRVGVGS
jgi:hypothetical protein